MKLRVVGTAQGQHLAVSPDGTQWAVLNGHAGAEHATRAVLLTDAHKRHASSLLDLRDGAPFELYATAAVFEQLTLQLPVLPVLQAYCGVHWRLVAVAGEQRLAAFQVADWQTLEFTALALGSGDGGLDDAVGEHIAIAVQDLSSGQRLFIVPALAHMGELEADWMQDSDCVVVGGVAPGAHVEAARRLQWLSELPASRKLLLATEGSGVQAPQGVELAYEGMEIEL